MGGFRKISLPFVVLSIPPKGKGNSALLAATKKRPTMEKGIFVSDINEFTPVIEGIFVTCDVAKLNDKNGNPYWSLGLSDSTGTVQAKIWSQRGVLQPRELQSRSFVHVRGQANKFRDNLQVRIDALTVLAQAECKGLRLEDYFPPSPYDGEKGMTELMDLVMKEVAGTPWERLVQVFFGDEENRRAFVNSSAARSMHHAGRGGLVIHTLEVCRICLAMADLFPVLDRPTLVTGALFHDIGKLEEMHTDPFEVSYTIPGNLIGHIVLGVAMLGKACEKADIPAPMRDHLFHLVLSHHGRIEFGAVREPASMEAIVLASADYMDAKLNTMQGLLEDVEEGALTPMQREFGRALYRAVRSDSEHRENVAPVTTSANISRAARAPQPEAASNMDEQFRATPAELHARLARPACAASRGRGQAQAVEEHSQPVSSSEPPQWEDGYLESLAHSLDEQGSHRAPDTNQGKLQGRHAEERGAGPRDSLLGLLGR